MTQIVRVKQLIKDTLDIRRVMLMSLTDLIEKRITPSDARARSWLARAALDTLRIEMIAAREGLKTYDPVKLLPDDDPKIEIDMSA